MIKIFTTLFLLSFFFHSYSQSCQSCVTLTGDANHGYKQLVIGEIGPLNSDTSQPEIAAAAWTCNALGYPTCNNRGLFKFSFSEIPANAVVTSAKLMLYAKPDNINGQTGNPTFGTANASFLQRVSADWTVANTGWNNQPATTTQAQKTLAQSTSTRQNYTVDITDFAQFWVNKPDSNFGMLLRLQTEQYYNSMVFYSGKAPADSLKPQIVICYSVLQASNLVLKGDTAEPAFSQILLDTKGPAASDTTQPEIAAAAWTCNFVQCNARGLFKYTLGQLPADAVINTARLTLHAKKDNINGQTGKPMFGTANTSLLQRVVSNWTVAGTGWNNQPSTTVTGQQVLPQSTSTIQDYSIDVTDMVRFWKDKPDSNFGMLLKLQNEQYYNSMIFYSGKAPFDSLKPRLEICYSSNKVLPLTITGFTISSGAGLNLLQWTMYDNKNLLRIEVERSVNGTTFGVINTVSNFASNKFSVGDNNIAGSDKWYYRLKMTRKDGTVGYSKILLAANSGLADFQVFPNPVNNAAQVKINVPQDLNTKLKIKSIDGREALTQSVRLKKGFNVVALAGIGKLSRGIYIISIHTQGKTLQQKVVIE